MKYGEHTKLVEEVLEFARSGNLLQGGEYYADHWHVIHALDKARHFAWQATVGVEEYLWPDVRELQMSRVKGASYGLVDFTDVRDALGENLKLLTILVGRRLDEAHDELLDDVVADLNNCAFSRAVCGYDGFFEELFAAYTAGGWPCGWRGEFSRGQLVVYVPR